VRIPLLHIADATAEAIRRSGQKRVGLPGTKFTMEHGFYADSYAAPVRDRNPRARRGGPATGSRRDQQLQAVIARLAGEAAESVIPGCTGIGLLVAQSDSSLPGTTRPRSTPARPSSSH
jgi:aspartate racemase